MCSAESRFAPRSRRPQAVRTVVEHPTPREGDALDAATERELLQILRAPAGGTARQAYHDKEHALGAVFARLAPLQARALQQRLANPREGDALAGAFARLVFDRRARLLEFLAGARRRAAIAEARRR
jgi:hypothetical protein